MKHHRLSRRARQAGFTLLEVLVAVLLTSIGIFGFLKSQAQVLSSTQVSAARSLAAMQASSLAAVMHGNPAYWAAGSAPASFSMSGTAVTDSTGVLNAPASTCQADSKPSKPLCTPAQLAAWDVQQWALYMNGLMPTYGAEVKCAAKKDEPVNCVITISWKEKYVVSNKNEVQDSGATGGNRNYTLYVQP